MPLREQEDLVQVQQVPNTLARILRFKDLLLLFIGGIIGTGIFLTPSIIMRQVGGSVALSLLVWLVGGLLSLLGALTYAELAARSPEAGGLYCYIRDGFGRLPAFLYGWCMFLVIASGSVAAAAWAFTRYFNEVIPLSPIGFKVVAVSMIGVVTTVNVWGTRRSSDLQNWTTLTKVGIIVILCLGLLPFGHHARELPNALRAQHSGIDLFSSFSLAMITVLWAYEGWQFPTYTAGEVVEPRRNFPRAFLVGSLIIVGLYLLAAISYLVALGPVAATASDAIAADSVTAVFGPWAGKIIALTILVSTFSGANGVLLTAPRVFYAMGQDKLFFSKLARIHPRFRTPAAAVVSLGVWSAVLACAGGYAELISGVIFIGWIFYGLGAASIFRLRKATAVNTLPYRVPGYPWPPLLFVLAAAILVGNAVLRTVHDPSGFRQISAAVFLFAIGVPAYWFWNSKRAGADPRNEP